jgi:formylglycine-generating enzyme required for sulfatase activity/WD40 repeat protein
VRWKIQAFPCSFAFSPDGRTLAVGRSAGDLWFLDTATGQQRGNISGHRRFNGLDWGAAFSPDGSELAVGSERKEMRFWGVKTGSLIGRCDTPKNVKVIAWSADGKTIATSSDYSSSSQIWDAALRKCVNEVPCESSRLGLSPDGKRLVNADGKAVRFWDLVAGRQLFEIPRVDYATYALSPDGKTLAVATEKVVRLYDTTTGAATVSLEGVAQRPGLLAWSPDGKTLAAVLSETIHLWDVASGQHTADSALGELPWLYKDLVTPGINSACWLDEATLVLGNTRGACVWDRRNHTILRTMYGYPANYLGCCFSPAARLAAFPGQGLIRLQSLDDGRLLYTLLSLRDDLTGMVSPEGHWRGAPGLEKELIYVVQTDAGQETFSPEVFAKKFGWKNDPSKAVPKAGGHPEDTRPKIEAGKPQTAASPFIGPDGKWKLPPGAPPPAIAPLDAQKAKEHQEAWAKHLGVPVEITNSIGMKLVFIPPGEFQMGSPKELIEEELKAHGDGQWCKDRIASEGPQHRVRITKPFYFGVYKVTQEEYQRVVGTNPSEFSATGQHKDLVASQDTKRFPVEHLSWNDTVDFCRKLSQMPEERVVGRTYRLPTEAQWEYACRAGSISRYGFSLSGKAIPKEDDEARLSDYGWFGNSGGTPHAVGGKRPSAWGLYDMHGNVWERCQDWYDKDYYTNSPADDPGGPPGGSDRVIRGGLWSYPAWLCRSANREHLEPGSRYGHLGFRVSLVLPDK